jgi:hypothetical protein
MNIVDTTVQNGSKLVKLTHLQQNGCKLCYNAGMAINQLQNTEALPAPKPESTKHLRTLANGAVYDMNIKRIVANPGGGTTAITPANATVLQARGVELKRDALKRAANRVADQGGSVDGSILHGDTAYIEAIGEAMTMKALSVNDPKAVDAARFIFTETGVSEKQAVEQHSASDPIAQALASLVNMITSQAGNVVNAEVIDMRSENDGVDN